MSSQRSILSFFGAAGKKKAEPTQKDAVAKEKTRTPVKQGEKDKNRTPKDSPLKHDESTRELGGGTPSSTTAASASPTTVASSSPALHPSSPASSVSRPKSAPRSSPGKGTVRAQDEERAEGRIIQESDEDEVGFGRYPRRKRACRKQVVMDDSDSDEEEAPVVRRSVKRKRSGGDDSDEEEFTLDEEDVKMQEEADASIDADTAKMVVEDDDGHGDGYSCTQEEDAPTDDEFLRGAKGVRRKVTSSTSSSSSSSSSSFSPLRKESLGSRSHGSFVASPLKDLSRAQSKLSAFSAGGSAEGRASLEKDSSAAKSSLPLSKADKKRAKREKFEQTNVERYHWLLDMRDANKRRPSDPGFDATTLYVPAAAYNDMSAFEQQYWDVKRENMDAVVFFKKGKFYELYEMDADLAHQEFDLRKSDRVNMRMAGVPEHSFEYWASKFLARGYKITRVDQVESSLALAKRKKTGGGTPKKQTVIQREVSQVLTAGTLTDPDLIPDHHARYLFTLLEHALEEEELPRFSCCVVDCAAGQFRFHSFVDDKQQSRLETLLVQLRPAELIIDKEKTSEYTRYLIGRSLRDPVMNFAEIGREQATVRAVLSNYFPEGKVPFSDEPEDGEVQAHLQTLAATLEYLKKLKIDSAVVHGAKFHLSAQAAAQSLVLDGQTLLNLEIVESSDPYGAAPTILSFLDHCGSAFGKRLLRKWVCEPLASVDSIGDRLDAVEILHGCPDLCQALTSCLRRLPDLERLLGKLKNACEMDVTAHGTVQNFVRVLEGLEDVVDTLETARRLAVQKTSSSSLLQSVLQPEGEAASNDSLSLSTSLRPFLKKFDRKRAKQTGEIDAKQGADKEYDEKLAARDAIVDKLDAYLARQKKQLRVPLKYTHQQKDKYQIEIAKNDLNGVTIPDDFLLMTETKAARRYSSEVTRGLLERLSAAEEELQHARDGLLQRILKEFMSFNHVWSSAVANLATLDALCSLTVASFSSGLDKSCRPVFVESEMFVIDAKDVYHPLVASTSDSFVANDIKLGGKDGANTVILTGPNMGGKSTMLRQVCLLVVLAQVGCYVPASSCSISVVDRIFTRIGASDNIFAGHSTFMVELLETNTVLQHATPRSLVILDELGRGTSTYDGYAIAYGVLSYLLKHNSCCTLFSTHYHMITEEFENNPSVALKHMACHIDKELKQVVYLYKMCDGVCPRSYGMNVACTAGIPESVVGEAHIAADTFEATSTSFSLAELRRRNVVRAALASVAAEAAGGDAAKCARAIAQLQTHLNALH